MSPRGNGVGHINNWDTFFTGFKLPHPPGKPDKQLPISHRVAFLLDWAAKRDPEALVPYNIVLKTIQGLVTTPRMSSPDVERMRQQIPRARPILQGTYHRDLVNVSGVGVRATTGDLDVVKRVLPGTVRKVNRAHESLRRTAALVDVAKLPATGPDRGHREWMIRTVSPALKALKSDERIANLLPPAPPTPTTTEGT